MATLNIEDVLYVHDYLTEYFEYSADPVSPPGVKSMDLLESAVARPFMTMYGRELYVDLFDKAAVVFHGLISNHSFHNGNKRTALLSTLFFLGENNYWVDKCDDNEMFEFTRQIAAHEICSHGDDELDTIKNWLEKDARRGSKGDETRRLIELRQASQRFVSSLIDQGRFWDVVNSDRSITERIIKKGSNGNEPYDPVYISGLRKRLSLTDDFGIDSERFYGNKGVVESLNEFMEMRGEVIRELAKI